ncbi:arylamine N-acetyltransferase 1 [Venturia nashicola]|uniref:Arylamine N-acetyltransferase 1 n=1 Tax=Venturia nashicola TaxID=86259 RepID=A0A4Z1NUT1_9PEZI|nr:arylamine N-acetyltransferase 1 [Venturia nashicola]TLD20800.1 arylamine N-acetyltransferase 1 [Venturia nashicola]
MASEYSKEEITQYYHRIRIPESLRIYDVSELSPKAALSYLKELQKHHLVSVPFENISLHYSPSRTVILHPEQLFRKIVHGGRGGYCMELNAVFGLLLRSLRYNLYPTGARVHDGREFGGWDHMLNLVTIGDSRYVIDVGFGSNYVPTAPLRLIHDAAGVPNVSPASIRLIYKNIDGSQNAYQKIWVFQHRTSDTAEFKDMYCFTDTEFRPRDFEMMNFWTSRSPKVIFTQRLICNKLILGDGEKEKEIVGTLTLMGELKRRVGAKGEVVKEFKSEEERIQALSEEFGITLSEVEKEAIKNTANEIR